MQKIDKQQERVIRSNLSLLHSVRNKVISARQEAQSVIPHLLDLKTIKQVEETTKHLKIQEQLLEEEQARLNNLLPESKYEKPF